MSKKQELDYSGIHSPRFFYFKSLYNDPNAAPAINYATSLISMDNLDFDEEEFFNSTLAGIELLKEMYEFEKNNEIRLIQEKILPLTKKFKNGKYQKLGQCIHDNEIDYISFMALLKELEDDTQGALKLLNDSAESLRNYAEAADKVIEAEENKNKIKNNSFTEIKRNRNFVTGTVKNDASEKIIQDLANIYADALRYNASNKSSYGEELTQALEKNLIPMLLSGNNQLQLNTQEEKIGYYTNLINYIERLARTQKETKRTEKMSLKKKILDLIKAMPKSTKKMNDLQIYSQRLLKYGEILDDYGRQLEDKLDHMGEKLSVSANGKTISGLEKNIRKQLENYATDQNVSLPVKISITGSTVDKETTYNPHSTEDKNNYVNWLVNELIPEKKDAPLEEIVKELNSLLKKTQQRKEILTLVTEHNSALTLASLYDAIEVQVDGYLNNKNDATLFTVGKAFIKTTDNTKVDNIPTDIQNLIKKALQESEKQFSHEYQIALKEEEQSDKYESKKGYNILAQTKAQANVEKLAIKKMKSELEEQGYSIKNISQLFQIDNSAKFSETFITPEGGFSGGSLGSTLHDQIENINQMYALGGLTPLDTERLVSMALNAGDGMIGSHNRSALENYFTIFGSMLMFRTGGNALQQWRKQATNKYAKKETTKIHIYTLGTYYVPESYIILKTYEALRECANIIQTEANTKGSRVRLYNPVTKRNIVDKKGLNFEERWQATAEHNYPKVKLSMVIMGGYLDLVDKILTVMNNIK